MNTFDTQAIVFYGTKEQVNLFSNKELSEKGAFTVDAIINGKSVEINIDTQREDIEEGSYVKMTYKAPDAIALRLAVYLMEDIDYLKSVAKIRNFSDKKETVFRHEERGFQECIELTEVEYKGGKTYGKLTATEGFYEEIADDLPLQYAFRWVGSPAGSSVSA